MYSRKYRIIVSIAIPLLLSILIGLPIGDPFNHGLEGWIKTVEAILILAPSTILISWALFQGAKSCNDNPDKNGWLRGKDRWNGWWG